MSAPAKFLKLTWRERTLFCAAAAMLPATAVALRVVGFRPLRAIVGSHAAERDRPADEREQMRVLETTHMVAAAAHYSPYRAGCLPQSLVLQWLLRRQGIATELRFGVRKTGPALEAHAWLEYRGAPLIDSAAVHGRFAALHRAEPGPRAASRGAR